MSYFSQIKEAAYWMDPHPTTKNYSNKPLPQKTDVLVIGSGYTGVVAALHLKKANVDVTLIDKGRIGSEASSKNGGMALAGLKVGLQKVKKKFGKDLTFWGRGVHTHCIMPFGTPEQVAQEVERNSQQHHVFAQAEIAEGQPPQGRGRQPLRRNEAQADDCASAGARAAPADT